jgi:7,8-dihydro-6-hydroxymethylpterin-pyrophosphokinase
MASVMAEDHSAGCRFKTSRSRSTGRFLLELPPEEGLESVATRLRPFTMRDEPVYWQLVLDAIAALTPQDLLDEVLDIEDLRVMFADITKGKKWPRRIS